MELIMTARWYARVLRTRGPLHESCMASVQGTASVFVGSRQVRIVLSVRRLGSTYLPSSSEGVTVSQSAVILLYAAFPHPTVLGSFPL